ncbi:hypothetical protein SAMN05192532_10867 [Alteribacillus iranensis]|uniref:Uncharacterized protein n=1 Tax=Alteribacillus iranensis TaxID=930128 RepID=A0A1I2F1Z3_9BACI|nr:hypothetical protein SAMN05192532_10867 [Alteribacillus iranensis]
MEHISNMNTENSVFQLSIPGKGKFTLVIRNKDDHFIQFEPDGNAEMKRMLKESQRQYERRFECITYIRILHLEQGVNLTKAYCHK